MQVCGVSRHVVTVVGSSAFMAEYHSWNGYAQDDEQQISYRCKQLICLQSFANAISDWPTNVGPQELVTQKPPSCQLNGRQQNRPSCGVAGSAGTSRRTLILVPARFCGAKQLVLVSDGISGSTPDDRHRSDSLTGRPRAGYV